MLLPLWIGRYDNVHLRVCVGMRGLGYGWWT